MAQRSLDDRGRAEVDDVIVVAPGLEGDVSVERPAVVGGRGTRGHKQLDEALALVDMVTEREVIIARPRDVTPAGQGTRGGGRTTRGRSPTMTITVPAPAAGREQALLSIDEHGVATWHFKGGRSGKAGVRGGKKTRTYTIPRETAAPRRTGRTRGLVPGLDKVIKVVSFPVAWAIGQGARFAVRRWDTERHPPSVRAYGPTGALTELSPTGWDGLTKGRTLLFVHGTFSTTVGGFGALPSETRRELDRRYGGRVIAYDHPTIADDPLVNAQRFFELAGDRKIELDIVCHSRGGLVSRAIAERPGDLKDLAPNVGVHSVVLVGVPSSGTILAEAAHWNELVDRATTLLNLVPAPGVVDALETVLALVRSIAVETAQDLEGLDAMAPHRPFLKRFNVPAPGGALYRAIVSDFEPTNPGLKEWLNDSVRDALFDNKANDMMVTIESMTGKNGSNRFPVTEIRTMPAKDAVEHARYFSQPATSAALLEWLSP
jgi:hypothetical protein